MRMHLGYWLVVMCAGCGGSGSTLMGNQVSGTVDGVTVAALGAIFVRDSNDDENGVHHELSHVAVGESADLCSIWRGSFIGNGSPQYRTYPNSRSAGRGSPRAVCFAYARTA